MDFHFDLLDTSSPDDLRTAAIIHESAPLNWDSSYKVTEDRILFWIDYLTKLGDDPNAWIMLAKTESGEIVGLHWIKIVTGHGQPRAKIESLWSSNLHRRQGIGSRLKKLGEDWALSRGAKAIFTDVFYTNKNMIDFNITRGFKPMQVEMMKELVGQRA